MPLTPLDTAIDVSDNNGTIDWLAVYGFGIREAMIKLMELPGEAYPWGPANLAAARKAGLAVIPYAFLRPCDAGAAIREFKARSDLGPGMAFALDWEGRANQTAPAPVTEEIGEGLAQIAQRKPLGYWGIPGSTPAAPTQKMQTWDRWVPRYPVTGVNTFAGLSAVSREHPEVWWGVGHPKQLPRFGQYTAWGRIPGIKGLVDRSVAFFENEAVALAWVKGEPAPAVA